MRDFRLPLAGATWLALVAGCSSPIAVDVQLVDPCNQEAIDQVDFLTFTPRGSGVDSTGLTTTQPADATSAPDINVPLVEDFQLVVTGHRDSHTNPPAGIGVSQPVDLVNATDSISVRVSFSLIESFHKTTQLEDPDTCTSMETPRYGATATTLASGQILIVGGVSLGGSGARYRRAIELFDPATGIFDVVGELQAGAARAFHTATLIDGDRVLIAGGAGEVGVNTESLRSAVMLDVSNPNRVSTDEVLTLRQARSGHTAVRLEDGRVLLAGGRMLNTAAGVPEDHTYLRSIEIFDPDPQRNAFIFLDDGTGSGIAELSKSRFGHSATLLQSGQEILVAGGFNETGPERSLEVVRISGEQLEVVTSSGATTQVGPIFHGAALAEDGRVLLSGGYDETLDADPDGTTPRNSNAAVEMWEFRPMQRALLKTCTAAMTRERGHHTITMVGRRALFVGGHDGAGAPTSNAEIVTLNNGQNCFAQVPKAIELTDSRARHTATLMPSGEVLFVGGLQRSGTGDGLSITSAEIFSPARAL